MEISITKADPSQQRHKPADENTLGFGKYFSDHMFLATYQEGKGWHDARIEPYGSITLDPAALVLHYGQEIFEGLKAYRAKSGDILLIGTDGLWEARNPQGEMFSCERLRAIIASHRDKDARSIYQIVMQKISDFRRNQAAEDDMTLMVIKLTG